MNPAQLYPSKAGLRPGEDGPEGQAGRLNQRREEMSPASVFYSVVIPAYNAERFIRQALDSAAGQTFTGFEIVVVDDGSTDSTVKEVEAWAQAHPATALALVRQQHGGIGAARNAGIRAARGQYVAFLDADDLWAERKLEAVALRAQGSQDIDVLCHDEWLVEYGKRQGLRHGPYTTYRQLLFRGNSLSTSATVVTRAALQKVGGFSEDPRFNGVEDYELWLRLAQAGCRIAYFHEILGTYAVGGHGITSRIEEHCAHYLNVLQAHFESWRPQNAYYRYLMRKRRAAVLRGAGRAFLHLGRHRDAFPWFARSLGADPLSWKGWGLAVLNLLHIRV
jgi:glycosyltransferase involved in cell wall biosynthesis